MNVIADQGAISGDDSRLRPAPRPIEVLAISLTCLAYAIFEARLPLNHDVAWLLDAGSRWAAGERLYVDLIEVNPPLVFYLYGLITLGLWTKLSFIAGLSVVIGLTSVWAARLQGAWWGVGSVIVILAAGVADFGQRDHFALIVAIPYLFAERVSRNERLLIGAVAFLGFALKPYLLLIPAMATIGRVLSRRSPTVAFPPENVALGSLGLVYLVIACALYPEFFASMVPLGSFVYFAYGTELNTDLPTVLITMISFIAIASRLRSKELWPFAGAAFGAFGSFYVQGRYWSYHLVPALGLTALFLLVSVRRSPPLFAAALGIIILLGGGLHAYQRRYYLDHIPKGSSNVLFVSAHVTSAYPFVVERGVRHTSRYPALWTLPGAWQIINDPGRSAADRRKAAAIMLETRDDVVGDIVRHCPDAILVDVKPTKRYFKHPFDYERFLRSDPRFAGYYPKKRVHDFMIYRRSEPCATGTQASSDAQQ